MRQPMFALTLLVSLISCAIPHRPSIVTDAMIAPEGRAKAEPLTQVEADLMVAQSIPDVADFGIRAYQEGRYDDAIQLFQEILKTKPNEHVVRYNMGLAYYQLKQYSEAIAAFEYIVSEVSPIETTDDIFRRIYPTVLEDARINLGMAYLQAGQRAKAAAALLEAMPDETAHYNLIVVYNSMGNYRRVIALAQDYFDTYGEDADIYNLLGLTYYYQNRYKQALQAFEKAAENNPASAEIQVNLGLLYLQMEHNPEAAAAFRRAQQLNPQLDVNEYLTYLEHFREREARIHYNRANQLMKSTDLGTAISVYKLAVELDPEFVEAHVNLGLAYAKK